MLGVAVDYIDIEATEPEYYKTLKQILDNSLESLMIDLTFVAESHTFGETEVSPYHRRCWQERRDNKLL